MYTTARSLRCARSRGALPRNDMILARPLRRAMHFHLVRKASKTRQAILGKQHWGIAAVIRQIPRGKVSTYGAIARAAGFPGAARQVAKVLRRSFGLPWQRVLGAKGEIKLKGDSAIEQRLRLEAEGVKFHGRRVNMRAHEFQFPRARRRNGGSRRV